MKAEDKNEMDVLLRALGRSPGISSPTHVGGGPEPHLDADELNCFAEGVVSTAERTRYIKHLADCDSCRRILAGLVPVASATTKIAGLDPKRESSWRAKLAVLFAPSMVRYGLPALAMIAMIAVALVVLRRPNTEFVAQNQQPPAPVAANSGEARTAPLVNPPAPAAAATQTQAPAVTREKNGRPAEPLNAPPPPPMVSQNSTANSERSDQLSTSAQGARGVAELKSTTADQPSPAAPLPQSSANETLDRVAEARKIGAPKKQTDEELQKERHEGFIQPQPRDENDIARARSAKGPSRNSNAGLATVMSPASSEDDKDASERRERNESRKVSGRLFKRQGNVWVDTDYAQGGATINVSRGSEHFRSLIADEPGLRAITQQLSGEVIVVWKGSVYRFR